TITLFFSDIEGFTGISEKLSPDQLVKDLGEYLDAMNNTIVSRGGVIDKFIGDAVMAFWNAPSELPDHAFYAVSAAIECQRKIAELRDGEWKRDGRAPFRSRIGLHTGPAVVGNVGSRL